jgi:hypothetical protein
MKRIRDINDVLKSENRVVSPSGCWIWQGKKDRCGYGFFIRDKKQIRVHRMVLESIVGPLGDHLACHKCDVPSCFNPDHLFKGTSKDNHADMVAKGRQGIRSYKPSHKLSIRLRVGKHGNRFQALVFKGNKQHCLGTFGTLEDAIAARMKFLAEGKTQPPCTGNWRLLHTIARFIN